MRLSLARTAAALLAPLLAPGCAAPESACTMIGGLSGVSVTVDRAVAADLGALKLRVCWDLTSASPHCRDTAVELMAGSDSVDQGCEPGGPDAACSATAVPNGSKVGFVQLDALSEGPITVAGTAIIASRRQTFPVIELTASPSYPNGPDCGVGGYQAMVNVGSDGLH